MAAVLRLQAPLDRFDERLQLFLKGPLRQFHRYCPRPPDPHRFRYP